MEFDKNVRVERYDDKLNTFHGDHRPSLMMLCVCLKRMHAISMRAHIHHIHENVSTNYESIYSPAT